MTEQRTTQDPAKAARKRRTARPRAAAPAQTRPPAPRPATKSAALIALLSRPKGTTLDEMMDATGWQAHSVRGFLAGTLKKAGHTVSSQKTDAGRIYRIVKADR